MMCVGDGENGHYKQILYKTKPLKPNDVFKKFNSSRSSVPEK